MGFAKIDIPIEEGITHALVKCSAVVDGLGEKKSKQHEIDVTSVEEPVQTLEGKESEEYSSKTLDYSEESDDSSEYRKQPAVVELVTTTVDNKPEFVEEEKSKILWIPFKPVEDIEDYQNTFSSHDNELVEEAEEEENFFRPSGIPEPPMLKQEKETKSY